MRRSVDGQCENLRGGRIETDELFHWAYTIEVGRVPECQKSLRVPHSRFYLTVTRIRPNLLLTCTKDLDVQ